ncbi:Ribokinase-like protein [Morchella conica CCBAS932]|uniref:pyridoxal kinase n=1 Tax=Morchella conica CCBAS932 TaxID=1392247 RepID=A0A3N4KHT8_9PEZI|nr:Ribokinase-like protein [Morchella conica CCBAS932]
MAAAEDSRVLAIASHVVSGYVGNCVTTFVLQVMGLEVSPLNTVQFSNHSGYKQTKGYRTTGAQIKELYEGLKMNGNDDFGMLLTGYIPGAEGVEVVGEIVRNLKERKKVFWLLDPVMGDQGRLYVADDVIPVYKSLLPLADLIVPNQFEAELLSGVKVDSLESLSQALTTLHQTYKVPHVIITSVTFGTSDKKMECAGSTVTSTGSSRKFVVDVSIIDGFFSGTGDMFAALTMARFRAEAEADGLLGTASWMSPDGVDALELPLARAVEKVLGSMHNVLLKTQEVRDRRMATLRAAVPDEALEERARHVRLTKASELRLVQSQRELLDPGDCVKAARLE